MVQNYFLKSNSVVELIRIQPQTMTSNQAQVLFDTFLEETHQMMYFFDCLEDGENRTADMRSTFIAFSENVLNLLKALGAEEVGV